MINHKKPIPSNKRFEIAGRGTAETAIQKFYDYITKKTAELFAVCQRMHIFAAVITTKVMRTIIVNTYWWWRSLQLIRS